MVQFGGRLGSIKAQLIGQGLQFPMATLYHLRGSFHHTDELFIHFLTDFRGCANAILAVTSSRCHS
jgi:hypothetical protein